MILMLPFQGFSIIDADKDGKISTAELKSMDNDDWNTVAAIFEVIQWKLQTTIHTEVIGWGCPVLLYPLFLS